MLPVTPTGPTLTRSQAVVLDDEFFSARPLAYFSARIDGFLSSLRSDGPSRSDAVEDFHAALGQSDVGQFAFNESDRKLQVAVDAISVRHHAAESLIRLLHAIARIESAGPEDAISMWATIADDPKTLHTVVKELRAHLDSDPSFFNRALFPPGTIITPQAQSAFNTAATWVDHAGKLLTSNDLTVNAAHNKLKHGMAIRARDDVRIELMTGPGPDADGNIPLSAFGQGRSVPIFDRPMVTYLSRPFGKPAQGLEVNSLRIDVPVTLAEAWMMAVVHSAVFATASMKHFAGRNSEVAPFPTLPTGPTPDRLLNGALLGYRGIVTFPRDDDTPRRETGIYFAGSFLPMTIDFENVTEATISEG